MVEAESRGSDEVERGLSPSNIENRPRSDSSLMGTDVEWEKWASRDPYYSVLTDPRFRSDRLTETAKQDFFASGATHAEYVLGVCSRCLDAEFAPRRILDFGCGVGRLVVPFARRADEVVGVDISPTMLAEAQANSDRHGITNSKFVKSDDSLSEVPGTFDLVHSVIVLQHIAIPRGRALFERLLEKTAPGGCGAIHVTFGWDVHAETLGVPPVASPTEPFAKTGLRAWARAGLRRLLRREELDPTFAKVDPAPAAAGTDPEMQMNFYNLSELMFLLQRSGVQQVHTELTDHGGALGAFMFFRKPG